jgi:hypothetical protein
MPPLPVIAHTIRVAFKWSNAVFLRPAVNVMHFSSDSYDIPSLITAIDANVTAAMWQQTNTDSHIAEYTLTPLDGSSASVVHATGSPAKFSGPQSGGDLLPQVAVLVKLNTASRGRRARGRAYLPWCQEGVVANGIYNATARAAQQTAWNSFRSAMASASKPLQVASYANPSAEDCTAATVESLTATQRLRQPR